MDPTNFYRSCLMTICGATATGKSGLAIALATKLNAVILSADSRQVYREFNIGTAKPSVAEQILVPHYLIDICAPTETLTVADYQAQAQTLITQFQQQGQIPLLVGGTGLYIRAVVQGLKIPRVAPQIELRSQLESLGQTQLYSILQQVDAVAAQKIHPNDAVRTLRALEVFYVTGRPISQQQGENPPDYPILQIGLDCRGESLRDRITQRTEQMIANGLVAEVEYLCDKYGTDLPLLNTLGYHEIKKYLTGEITLDAATELTVLHTRQFAKRQRTWFRAYPQIEWFDADAPDLFERVYQRVQAFLNLYEYE
ncbi:tRNA (adenosine(37)-N6)-dimethylallyltransferase MiaA [Chroogloeocystis siderophila]|jgi:tRNA dimethylallyltransferase|uniref:tRNA dimethylallyltransferase n=1 Tax=Chroogloeocystis siderophila 5.2 s.c.1 TaxID=247279 RepID=A0A1U7HKD3_9CHRO|nr:tRNA (adenosine(37)-N6)-dimethylallyltransferase MiaA [Chroogloeocystis siderophila]OKH23995.1 tRNA (adenosine(37)-N6)-dimethylallyltransferase MiaA [Chroogloeocystis siderophila 5.2 s.c.1]